MSGSSGSAAASDGLLGNWECKGDSKRNACGVAPGSLVMDPTGLSRNESIVTSTWVTKFACVSRMWRDISGVESKRASPTGLKPTCFGAGGAFQCLQTGTQGMRYPSGCTSEEGGLSSEGRRSGRCRSGRYRRSGRGVTPVRKEVAGASLGWMLETLSGRGGQK